MANEYYYTKPPKAIPGFITLTLENNSLISISLNAIQQIRPNNGTNTNTIVSFLGGHLTAIAVKETHEGIMSLIHQAQHPAS